VEQGGEIRLRECPFCGSTSRAPFSIDPHEGFAKCHRCDWKGGLTVLKRSQGDLVSSMESVAPVKKKYVKPPPQIALDLHQSLLGDSKTLSLYLKWRVLDLETIKKFKIGFDKKRNAISFPYYVKGELTSIKFKTKKQDGSKFITRWTPEGVQGAKTISTLYNVDSLRGNETVYVVEGEEDCMVLEQAGFKNVVSIPNGAQSCSGDFLDAIEPFEDIVICFDSDEAGQTGAKKLAESLGEARCRITLLPEGIPIDENGEEAKDLTDFARAGQLPMALEKLDAAEGEAPESVQHIREFLEEFKESFLNGERNRGDTTGFPSLDNLIGGRRPGEITVISGNTGSGKSTFCLNTALNIAATGEAVLLGSFEQTIPAIMRKMAQMISGRWFHMREDDLGRTMSVDDLDSVIKVFSEIPLYVINVFGQMSTEEFVECVKFARRRLKVKTIILDHIHFMLRHERADSERMEIDNTMLTLKQLTIERDLSCYVVAHPRKKQGDENPVIGIEDFRGSSFISQVADNVLVVWRDRDISKLHPTMGRAQIHSLKCRSECGSEGKIDMAFSYAGQKFIDSHTEEIKPVWNDDEYEVDDIGSEF